jgi:hypothetical protein
VLEENWEAVQVFQLCSQTWLVGMTTAHAMGFTAAEVDAACRLRCVPPRTRPTVSEQVKEMGSIAAEELNRRK